MNKDLSMHLRRLVLVFLLAALPGGAVFASSPGKGRTLAAILMDLDSPDQEVREAAIKELSEVSLPSDGASIRSLARLLTGRDYAVKLAAHKALKKLAGKGVPTLIDVLLDNKTSPELRCKILDLFCDLGPDAKEAVPAILKRLKSPDLDGNEISSAGSALAKAAGRDAVPLIVKAFPDHGEEGRRVLAEALERIAWRDFFGYCRQAPPVYQQTIPILVQGLASKDESLRASCLKTLGMIGTDKKDIILAIAESSKGEDAYVKCQAAIALGLIGPSAKGAAPYFKDLLASRYNGVLWYTLVAAERIGLQDDFVERITEIAKTAEHVEVREQAVRILGTMARPSKDVFAVLEKRLADDSKFVSLLAAHSLAKLNPMHRKAREQVLAGCKDEDAEIRAMAARLLPSLPAIDERIVSALGELLDDAEPAVCIDSALSIWQLKDKAKGLKEKLVKATKAFKHKGYEPLCASVLIRLDPGNTEALKRLKENPEAITEMLTKTFADWRLFGIEVAESLEVVPASLARELSELTMDEDARVRQAAAALIKKLKR